jgi:hypothetical protein
LWVNTNDKTDIVPKDDGCGNMMSAFECNEFGSGLEINKEESSKARIELYG